MEVFSKYFRRLLTANATHIFSAGGRSFEPNGNYQLLVTEMHKLQTDPDQAIKIAESLNSPEGDLFREFDLATFIDHFQLDVFSKAMLAATCKSGNNVELRARGRLWHLRVCTQATLTVSSRCHSLCHVRQSPHEHSTSRFVSASRQPCVPRRSCQPSPSIPTIPVDRRNYEQAARGFAVSIPNFTTPNAS